MPRQIDPVDAITAWDRLANGKPLGKKVIIPYTFDAAGVNVKSAVSVLQLHGETDLDAQQLSVLISAPRVIEGLQPAAIPAGSSEQNVSGSVGNEDSSANWPDLYAEVEWGIGGVSNKALVDMINGCALNVCASFLRVRMGAASTGSEDDGGGVFECSAYVGPGWPKQPNAQRTVFCDSFTAGETDIKATPHFAKSVTVVGTTGGATLWDGWINFYRDRAKTFPVATYYFNSNQELKFPVPNGAMYFTLSEGSSGLFSSRAVFELAI